MSFMHGPEQLSTRIPLQHALFEQLVPHGGQPGGHYRRHAKPGVAAWRRRRAGHCIHHPHAVASTATITRESLYHRFLEALQRERPEVLATLERQQAQRREQAERDSRLGQLFRSASAATSHHRRQQQQEQQQQQQQEQQQQQGCDSPSHRLPPHPGGDHQLEPQAPSSGFAFGFQL